LEKNISSRIVLEKNIPPILKSEKLKTFENSKYIVKVVISKY
jgi:hypothetical protein